MLPLDNPMWSELSHAYGPASDIPAVPFINPLLFFAAPTLKRPHLFCFGA